MKKETWFKKVDGDWKEIEMAKYETIWVDSRHGQGWMCPYCEVRRSHTLVTHNNAMFRLPRPTSQLVDGTLIRG
jgi:hypothetical protein